MSKIEIRTLKSKVFAELREEGEDKRVVGGLGIPYGEYEGDPDFFLERFMPGSFKSFDVAKNRDVTSLFNHNRDMILGRLSNNTLRLMDGEDGLRYEIDVPKTSYGDDFMELVREKYIDGASIGFIPVKETWDEGKDGVLKRTITEAILTQVSPEATPWYSNTSSSLRSIEDALERYKEEKRKSEEEKKKTEVNENRWEVESARRRLDLKNKSAI